MTAQEVLKKTGKYHPVHQWFYFDSTEALPENVTDSEATGMLFIPTRSRPFLSY